MIFLVTVVPVYLLFMFTYPLATLKLRRDGRIICRQEVRWDWRCNLVGNVLWAINWFLYDGSLVVPCLVSGILYVNWRRYKWQWRRHKDHEEDCTYGPRKHHGTAKNRIKIWWTPKAIPVPA